MSKSDEVLAQQLADQGVTAPAPKQHVTLAEAKAEAAGMTTPGDAPEASADKPAKGKRAAKAKTADDDGTTAITTPRVKIAPGSTPAQVLAAHIPDQPTLYEQSRLLIGDKPSAATYETVGGIINKLAKKVGEKAVNLIRHRSNPESVQVYTRIAMDKLLKDGELSSKGLTDTFLVKYTAGTARAQANQIMQLFPALKIADKVGSNMTLNDDSVIVQAYRSAKG